MEWVIFLVLAFLGYMWARKHEAQKKERLELRLFSHRRWFTDYMGQDWDLDFVDMSLIGFAVLKRIIAKFTEGNDATA